MFGFRQKLVLGFGGLLAILLVVSALGVAVLSQYRTKLDKFYYENWRSVDYGQNMVDNIERLNDVVKNLNLNLLDTPPAELLIAKNEAAPFVAEFNKNLDAECHNITLPGEREIAEQLCLRWSGRDLAGHNQTVDCYQNVLAVFFDTNRPNAD